MKSEAKIQNEILLALNKTYSDRLRIWRNNVGQGYGTWVVIKAIKELSAGRANEALQTLKSSRPVTYGVPGSPDLQGFIKLNGRAVYLGIEVKKEGGTQEATQRNFQRMILSAGGFYFVAKSAEEAIEYVQQVMDKFST